jgi:UDPglucose--hexose-1-phosphate uridylyltransferase
VGQVSTELRRDPVTGRWVAIDLGPVKYRSDFDPRPSPPALPAQPALSCPFCEGHESEAGPELLAWRAGTPANSRGWSVRVVPNRRPMLRVEARGDRRVDGLFESCDGLGADEVVIETPAHDETLHEMPAERIWRVLWAWRSRLQDLRRDIRLTTGVVIKSHGAPAGAALDHAYSRILMYPFPPPALDEELEGALAHHERTGGCVYCEILEREVREQARLVVDAGDVVVVAPYASRVPFEMCLLPRAHGARFEEASDAMLTGLSRALGGVLRGIAWALENPPYNLVLHTAPFDGRADTTFHWHLEVLPRVTRIAGLEWGSGLWRNPFSPEEAAATLVTRLKEQA